MQKQLAISFVTVTGVISMNSRSAIPLDFTPHNAVAVSFEYDETRCGYAYTSTTSNGIDEDQIKYRNQGSPRPGRDLSKQE